MDDWPNFVLVAKQFVANCQATQGNEMGIVKKITRNIATSFSLEFLFNGLRKIQRGDVERVKIEVL